MIPAFCKSCGAPIVWARTSHGKAIPLDPIGSPGPAPTLAIESGGVATLRPKGSSEAIHRSHFETCPNAAQHRKARQ